MYMTHTKLDLDILYMHGERTKYPFQWNWSQVQPNSDSTRIAEKNSISRVQLVQELSTLKLMPRSHMTSNWGVLGVHGKLRRKPFQWSLSHVEMHPESTGIVKRIGHLEFVLVLHRRF
jgi:hypothetical protein